MWRLQFAQPTEAPPCFAQARHAWLWPTRKVNRHAQEDADLAARHVVGVRSERLPYEGIFADTATDGSGSEADAHAVRSVGATTASAAAASSALPSTTASAARDSCLLSYEAVSLDSCTASRLRAVSVEGSRILVREANMGGGGGDVRASTPCSRHLTLRRAAAPVYDVDDEDEAQQGASSSSLPYCAMQVAQWRLRASALLAAVDAEPLQRVRRYDHAATTVTALSASTLFLLDLAGGAEGPRIVQSNSCQDCVMSNLTCFDYWGPQAVVVGSSDGTVRLYDWRVRGEDAAVAAVTVQVPMLHSRAAGRWRGQRVVQDGRAASTTARTVRAGVLSCCAFEHSYRVVCGLVDPHHSLTIADLRRPCGAPRKRGNYTTPQIRAHALLVGLTCSPTGRPVTDLRHCPAVFGRLGIVDNAGRGLISSIVDLERGMCGAAGENVTLSADDGSSSTSLAAACGGRPATVSRNRTSRTPVLLDPAHVALRLGQSGLLPLDEQQQAMSSLPTNVAQYSGVAAAPVSLQLRCDFVRDGAALVHTQPGPLRACVTGELGTAHELRVTGPSAHAFTSVSCIDELVCLDTTHGDSFCFTLPN